MRVSYWIWMILVNIVFIPAYAQDYKFDHITTDNGLSQGVINCIFQDKEGFIWIGTNDGLNRYDAYSFKIYKNISDDSSSISGNIIVSIAEDSSSNLWIATRNDGLNFYNRKLDKFSRYQFDKNNYHSLSSNNIKKVFVDNRGNILIGTLGGGLNVFNTKHKTFTCYKHKKDDINSLSDNYVFDILDAGNGKFWIGSRSGMLDLFDISKGTFEKLVYKNDFKYSSGDIGINLLKDAQGDIWVSANDNGLFKIDPTSGHITPIHVNDVDEKTSSNLYTSLVNFNGNILVGSDGNGLTILDKNGTVLNHIKHDPSELSSLSNNAIYSIFIDNAGSLWIGTYQSGINLYNQYKYKFDLYTQQIGKPNSLSNKSVLAIFEDKEKRIWIGTDGGGLELFDPFTKSFIHYHSDPNNRESLSGNVVKSICEDHAGNLWIGTYANGLNLMDRNRKSFKRFLNKIDNSASIGHNNVWVIYEDHRNNLWLGLMGGGLDRMDPVSKTFIHYAYKENNPKGISSDNVKTILEDNKGNLWVGTETGGLNLLDRETNTFDRFEHSSSNPESVPSNDIRALFQDSQGIFWIGTSNGLVSFDYTTKSFKKFNLNDALPSKVINGIIEDEDGNLWISSNKGLSRYCKKDGKIRSYDISDGLQGSTFNYTSIFKSPYSGKLYFGGTNGFNVFSAGSIKDNPAKPEVHLINLFIAGHEVKTGDTIDHRVLLKSPFSESTQITLTYHENDFEIEFAALDFVSPNKVTYRYKLEGVDKQWIITKANQRVASYMNLAPGKYTFKVQASAEGEDSNAKEAAIDIVIEAAWWNTWTFRICILILVLVCFRWFYRMRMKTIASQNIKLENAVEARTHELKEMIKVIKDKSDALFLTGSDLSQKAIDLSKGTDSQSKAAIEIKRALSEVTEHSRQNSENAQLANAITFKTMGHLDEIKKCR